MKLGFFTTALPSWNLSELCEKLAEKGVQMIELGCGGYPGTAHCDAEVLLHDEDACKRLADTVGRHGLEISAFSAHGNMIHPDPAIASRCDHDLTNAILLAEKMNVPVVNTLSGCPGGCPEDKTANWVTYPFPDYNQEILKYQWNDVLIPYWKEKAAFAEAHGVKIAIEAHPGFMVYNTKTMLRLREAVGSAVGINLDPSHFQWQGMDISVVIRELGAANAIHHVHAKDARMDVINLRKNGLISTDPYSEELERPWNFAPVGYGVASPYWETVVYELHKVGYDYVISIENEDPMMNLEDGAWKSIDYMKKIMFSKQPDV